jgi:hypothetical protein
MVVVLDRLLVQRRQQRQIESIYTAARGGDTLLYLHRYLL